MGVKVRRPETQNEAAYQPFSFEQAENWYNHNFRKFIPGCRSWWELNLIEQHALMAVMQSAYNQGKQDGKSN